MINQTNIIFLLLFLYSIINVVNGKYYYILIPFIVFILNEILFLLTSYTIFPTNDIVENFYDISIIPTLYDKTDHNYSEGYYPNDDYTITPKQAENNKFDKIIEYLGAVKGDTILDMGCGTSTFGIYCKEKGIQVIGITLSSEQVKHAKKNGLTALQLDYTKYHPELEGIADHINMMGSLEHPYGNSPILNSSYEYKNEKIAEMLKIMKRYFKPDNKPHRIFVSVLHCNPKSIRTWEMVCLSRSFGGLLIMNTPELNFGNSAEKSGLKIIEKRDSTKEYYLATELNPNHFGNPAPWNYKFMILSLVGGIVYPYLYYMYVYYVFGIWMWMFDGKHHYYHEKRFSLETESKRPATLWWYVCETIPQTTSS